MGDSPHIGLHKHITLQYSLTTGANVVVRPASSKPIGYIHGCGTLFPKLEAALEGRSSGEVVRVKLLPQDAFGLRDTDLLQEIPLETLPPGERIEMGSTLVGHDETGAAVEFRVTGIENGLVKLDANHPLAGETLVFEIEIQDIRAASAEEIRAATAASGAK